MADTQPKTLVWRGQVLDIEAVPVTGYQLVMQVGPPIDDEVRVYFVPGDEPRWQERVRAALETIAMQRAQAPELTGEEHIVGSQIVLQGKPKRGGNHIGDHKT